jgi:diguanylate cyclase (GGDEF)-like protein
VELYRPIDSHEPDGDCRSGLDGHATAALDRLTRWAAKALRASEAIVTLVNGDRRVLASTTGPATPSHDPRMAQLADRVLSMGQAHAIGDLRPERGLPENDIDGGAFLGAPLVDRDDKVVGSFCVADTRPRRWTIQDTELVGELAASAMTEVELHHARSDAEREQRWSDNCQAVLELIAQRAPLQSTLDALLRAAEAHAPGMVGSILLLARRRGAPATLRHAAAPSLPRSFTSACVGVVVAEGRGICGTAAFRGEPVVVEDIAGDPLTAPWGQFAADHGLRAGWSTPIYSSTGALLGTFAMYFRARRVPDAREQHVIDRSTHLARLAIEQADDARKLRRSASRAQSLAREQTALQRVATSVASESDPGVLFALVAEQVGRLLKAAAGYVVRFENDDCYRSMGIWARGLTSAPPIDELVKQLPDGMCAQLRHGRTVRRLSVAPNVDPLHFSHRIAAPILVDGRAWGMVAAARQSGEFPRDDEKRIVRFAQLAAVAVANAHAHERLATQARTDPLTGLANRRFFDERLAQETDLANRHMRALSVMLVDVDHFKAINDRFGHATGDRVLVNLADSLRAVMRSGDLLARHGGDEMAMILPDCGAEEAAHVVERMLAAIAQDTSLARRHGVSVSAGVAGHSPGQSAEDLLRCADQALYRAKDEGRNQVVSYEPDMSERVGLRLGA